MYAVPQERMRERREKSQLSSFSSLSSSATFKDKGQRNRYKWQRQMTVCIEVCEKRPKKGGKTPIQSSLNLRVGRERRKKGQKVDTVQCARVPLSVFPKSRSHVSRFHVPCSKIGVKMGWLHVVGLAIYLFAERNKEKTYLYSKMSAIRDIYGFRNSWLS